MPGRLISVLVSSLALVAATAMATLPAVAGVAGASDAGRSHGYEQSPVCGAAPVGRARCLAHVVDLATPEERPLARGTSPTGYSPYVIDTAYGFSGGGSGRTIAIVDAYGDPTVTANLATFSSRYGLRACSVADGCFEKVNQTGSTTSFPRTTSGWALEQSLDVEWAHALAPTATILLVEANSSSFTNLLAAVRYAADNAQYVSMSWGGNEFRGETTYDSSFGTTGVSFFAASGDAGGRVIYPSASPDVISVGGTTLDVTSTGSWASETAWSTAGGGCSTVETASTAQAKYLTSVGFTACGTKRATPDISLDANPYTGVSVYDTVRLQGSSGWFQVGGTSASTVMVAGRSADTASAVNATDVYGGAINVYDVTEGSNGYACAAGYDLCTGLGSWNTAVGSPPSGSTAALSVTLAAGQTVTRGPWHRTALTVSVSSMTSPVSGATVMLSVYDNAACSTSPLESTSGTTSSGGTVTFTFRTKTSDTYCAIANASKSGYSEASSVSQDFTVV